MEPMSSVQIFLLVAAAFSLIVIALALVLSGVIN